MTQPLWNDQRQAMAQCLSLAEAEDSAGSRIPPDDVSIGVRHDHGVTEHSEQLRQIQLRVHEGRILLAMEKKEAPIRAGASCCRICLSCLNGFCRVQPGNVFLTV